MTFILSLIATKLLKINGMLPKGRCMVLSMVNKIGKLQFLINDLKKCGYKKDNCELNYKFLNNLQPEWKQYGTLMRQTKNLMDINIDALYNILKQNQGDVNDALGYKKKAVVITSDPLALVAEKMKVNKQKEKVVVSLDSKGSGADDFSALKKITALLEKAFNQRKFYSKPTNNNLRTSSTSQSANKKQEFVKSDDKKVEKKDDEKKRDMSKVKCFNYKKEGHFAKDCKKEKVLSESDESSSSAKETIVEVAYYTSESKSQSEFETLEYYDNTTNYSLFVNNDDDQEFFHDAIESASENFIENHIDFQKDYDNLEAFYWSKRTRTDHELTRTKAGITLKRLCQPMDQNIDFFGSDQIQTPQYPDVHLSSQEISDEVFQAKGDLMNSIQTFLEEFNYIPFEEKPHILLQAWFKFFAIKHAQPEDSYELFQKLLEDLKELADALNSKLLSINSQHLNKEKQEFKNVVEQPAERKTRIEKSLQNFRVIHKNSISLKNTSQISPVHAVAPILSTKEPEYLPSMGYEHSNTTPVMKSDEIIKSGVEELVPILRENEVTSEDKRECDVLVCENSPICDDHSEIFSNSKNDDDVSSDDDDFEDIEYVEASLLDPEIVSVEEENVVYQEEEEVDFEDIFQIQDIVLREKLLRINRLIANIESWNDNPTPDCRLINVMKNDISDDSSNDPLLEEADLFLSDNSIPLGIENFAYDSEGDIRFLEELLIDDSIPFPNNESSESDFDNPSFPRPPPEPPDDEFNAGEEISVVIDELECPKYEFDVFNDDCFSFMFVIRIFLSYLICSKMFLSFLSAESEDTIFDPGFTPHRLKFLVFGYLSQSVRASHPFFEISLGKSIFLIKIPSGEIKYPDVHPSSQEMSDEVFQAKGDLMNSIQTFLEEFNYIPFEEKPHILLQAWFKFFAIKHAQPEDSNELFQKLLEDLKELAEYTEEVCCVEVSEEQKHNMEDTILELVKICQEKELLCMLDNVDDLIESALSSKLLSINSQHLNKEKKEFKNVVEQPAERKTRIEKSLQNFRVIHKNSISLKNTSQISPVHAFAPILSTKEPEYLPSMGYEHSNTTPVMKSDEIIKSGIEELVSILRENEVTSEDKRECDVLVCENSPICDDHSEIFSDSKNDDDISSDDDNFEDIEYVEASLPDPEIVKSDNSLSDNFSPEFETFCDHTEETRSGSTTTHADDSLPEYDSFCLEIEPDQERLINVIKNDIFDDSSNDPLLEEADLFLSDNSIPLGIENFSYDSEGDIRFLEELVIEDSIPFPNNESSESDFDNPSFPRPPLEPPDDEFNAGEEISVVIDELECPKDEFDVFNDDCFFFMFVIRIFLSYLICSKMFLSFLFAESEDTIFDPGFTPHRLKFLMFGYLSRSARASHPFFEISLGKFIFLINIA
nr:nucleolar protein 58-like [Tanacetum cinerariifolium]